jgi:hypothetical protein
MGNNLPMLYSTLMALHLINQNLEGKKHLSKKAIIDKIVIDSLRYTLLI